MIHVIAIITAKPGKRDAVLSGFHRILPEVRAEEGCLEFGPVVDSNGASATATKLGPDTFMVVEKWTSLETHAAHSASPHMTSFRDDVKDLVQARLIYILNPADG